MLQQVTKGRSYSASEQSELKGFAQDAKWAFEESLAQNPLEAGALFGLSWIFYNMKDFSCAIKTVTRLIGLESLEGRRSGKVSGIRVLQPGYLPRSYCSRRCCA